MSVLKTAFPLLALAMETMVDQIQKHFKCPPDEDAYRLIVALLNDGLSVSESARWLHLLLTISSILVVCLQLMRKTLNYLLRLRQTYESSQRQFFHHIYEALSRKTSSPRNQQCTNTSTSSGSGETSLRKSLIGVLSIIALKPTVHI